MVAQKGFTQQSEHFLFSFFLYILTSVKDFRRGLVYKCKVGVSGIQVAQRAMIAHLSPMCQSQISLQTS